MGIEAAIIGGSILGAGASISASRRQASAANQAAGLQAQATQQARQDLAPFRAAGESALNPLQDFISTPESTDLRRAEGFREIQNSAAARGKLGSGGTLTGLVQFNNMLNESKRQRRFNELFNVAVMGSNAAAGQATATQQGAQIQGDLLTQAGNARAAGLVGGANAVSGGIENLLLLDLYKR